MKKLILFKKWGSWQYALAHRNYKINFWFFVSCNFAVSESFKVMKMCDTWNNHCVSYSQNIGVKYFVIENKDMNDIS